MSERRTRSGGAAQGSGERGARGRDGAPLLEGRSSVREALPLPAEAARTGKAPPTGLLGNLPSLFSRAKGLTSYSVSAEIPAEIRLRPSQHPP